MRILFVSDLHYALKQLDWLVARAGDYDVVAIGGDLLDLRSDVPYDVQIVVVEEYLRRLRKAAGRVLVCSGSHDGDRCDEAEESVAGWLLKTRCDGVSVDFDHVRLGKTLITICPWWSGPVGRLNVESLLEDGAAMKTGQWIWMHHMPPDRVRVSQSGRRRVGSRDVLALVQRHRPNVVMAGHVHDAPFQHSGSWVDRLGPTWVMNPGRQAGPEPSFIALDLESMEATWTSAQGTIGRVLREAESTGA